MEETRTNERYQYNFSAPKSVQMILDAKKVNIPFQADNLYFAQVVMENGEILNIIFRQSDDQFLTLLYGLGDTEFLGIIEALKFSRVPLESDVAHNVQMIDHPKYAVKTTWSTRLQATDGLISPLDYE